MLSLTDCIGNGIRDVTLQEDELRALVEDLGEFLLLKCMEIRYFFRWSAAG